MSQRRIREQIEAIWREKLHQAEQAYGTALAHTQKVQAEYDSMPPSDGNLALEKAFRQQSQAMDEYVRVLQTFTRLILHGEQPEGTPRNSAAVAETVSDLDIQEWVHEHHGFVPHPAWIAHCKELYLGVPPVERSPASECPAAKRAAIREAFLALGILGGSSPAR